MNSGKMGWREVVEDFVMLALVVIVGFLVASVVALFGSALWVLWTQPFDHPQFAWWMPKLLVTDLLSVCALAAVWFVDEMMRS